MASQAEALEHQNDVELNQEQSKEEEEVEKLEAEVKEMAQKILNYRTTLPRQLKSTLSSFLASQRPILPTLFDSGSESQPGPSSPHHPLNPDMVRPIGSGNQALLAGEDQESEKIRLLKQKISSNASTIPVVLKRMKDCMTRIDNLDSCNEVIIHPAFKRKRTS
ncbi:hypothetical protein ACH5RR_024060 [Cinchona calisaya]|uniref:Uncharacterized protein n=1 Tax=Cinchona calisaya TaxID=153742 RepID=A0ABD2ZHF5_9GENT